MIKEFSIKDFHQCCELLIQTYNAPPWNEQWIDERAQIRLQDTIDNKRFVGYTLWNNCMLVGAVFAYMKTIHTGNQLFVEDLFISPAHQRKGYGMELMAAIEKYAKENDCMAITLLTGKDFPAFDFYLKRGYKCFDSIPLMHKRVMSDNS